ncbi:MAG: dienelactone hydrolase family protein [Deltaproteobacteria bacterium]|nr:dienelactone hydrolase family protein [Deltaproteobacteria bacterium]
MKEEKIKISLKSVTLDGIVTLPPQTKNMVVFAHGTGSSRLSPRNQFVARVLNEAGMGTLLFDLLTSKEDQTYETRFNIALLTQRLSLTAQWLLTQEKLKTLEVGFFGASTGAAAALEATVVLKNPKIKAIVSRGGRPDLALSLLPKVTAPTLLIVGGADFGVIELNQKAYAALECEKKLVLVPKATHLFEEPGTLEEAAQLAKEWFISYLPTN